jgi:hypothetical protein
MSFVGFLSKMKLFDLIPGILFGGKTHECSLFLMCI